MSLINDAVIIGGYHLTFGNMISGLVRVLREDVKVGTEKATLSWEVLKYKDINGGAIRKRAARLEDRVIQAIRNAVSVDSANATLTFKYKSGAERQVVLKFTPKVHQLAYEGVRTVVVKKTFTAKPAVQQQPAKFMLLPDSAVVIHNGRPVIVGKDHINFKVIYDQLVKDGTYDPVMLEPVRVIEKFAHAGLTYENGKVKLDGSDFKYQMFDKLVEAIKSDNTEENLKKLFAFVRRAIENSSNQITERILDFAKCSSIDFTDDGMMICFKKVTKDYKDVYTKTIDNSVGTTVQVARSQVDENMDRTCSYGLHVASISYMSHYPGDRVLKVLVDPADVVAIPRDYNDAKMRCCKYVVLEDVTKEYNSGALTQKTKK